MKTLKRLAASFIACGLMCPIFAVAQTERTEMLPNRLNAAWRFNRGETPGAESPGFDDSKWKLVDLPHDWSIEEPPGSRPGTSPHEKGTPEGTAVGHLRGGVGWYRLHLAAQTSLEGRGMELILHGAQQECDVWVNGHHIAFQPHGYVPLKVDIARHLGHSGQDNVIAVRVLNPESNTRWYSGSGLYRGASLRVHDDLYIPTWGARVDTLWLKDKKASLQLRVEVRNDHPVPQNLAVELELTSPDGGSSRHSLGSLRLAPGKTEHVNQELQINQVHPWFPDTPELYVAKLRLVQNGRTVDQYQTSFGVRTVFVSADKGLLINGRSLKLKGACLHHDNGLLGACAFPDAELRRVRLMKANGFNAIRTSHNPPSTEFLDACDQEGVLVIDEFADTWQLPKKLNGYQRYFDSHWENDLGAMVSRDFNHPSVIIWSIGNEIPERFSKTGVELGRKLASFVRGQDLRRPVTNAINSVWENPELNNRWEYNDPAFAILDIGGCNYAWREYESDHARCPQRVILGTESYPFEALENWRLIETNHYIIGDFVWTGMDHLGESGIGHSVYIDKDADPTTTGPTDWEQMPWPWWINWSGDLDLVGNKKPQSLYRDVVWRRSAVELCVHEPIPAGMKEKVGAWGWPMELPSWNWATRKGQPLEVSVYSRAERVRLELNGRVIGEQAIDPSKSITARFTVPWEPGALVAKALDKGAIVAVRELRTTGPASSLRCTPESRRVRAARESLLFIPIEVTDAKGALVPDAAVEFTIAVEGEATLQAFGSANPTDLGSVMDSKATSFRGRALAILRSTGKAGSARIRLSASGFQPITTTVEFVP